jgi:hypothetical protein
MGLGKTAQVIAFLAGLHRSGAYRPTLVVCPATVLRQWLRELRSWYPPFRVAILHESAGRGGGAGARAAALAAVAASPAGVLLTTYEQLRSRRAELLGVRWGYAVLDEGHKIRNPDAEVTLAAKQLPTVHRLIMVSARLRCGGGRLGAQARGTRRQPPGARLAAWPPTRVPRIGRPRRPEACCGGRRGSRICITHNPGSLAPLCRRGRPSRTA